jgi:hypothetical protein
MARTRDIRPNLNDTSCDICGRTLLRGEHAETFLAGGSRRQVCDLCTARAQHEGWIRESGGDELALRHTRHDGRTGFLDRFRARRRAPTAEGGWSGKAAKGRWSGAREVQEEPVLEEPPVEEPDAPARQVPEPPRRPRHVRAVPTNADLKMQRALEVFNGSDHTRTVGGVARSLGAPAVSVRPRSDRPAVVAITVMWELSWYRFEIDLSDEAGGVRRDAQGDELADLGDEEQEINAAADERGNLHLA